MEETKKCPKCGGEMEKGYEMAVTMGGQMVWIKEGKATKISAPTIKGYSCLKCGYIENYTQR